MAYPYLEMSLAAEQGDTIDVVLGPVEYEDPITRADAPIDLSLPSMKLSFTAKRNLADADIDAEIRKGFGIVGLTGVTLNSPASPGHNYATVRIEPADTATLAPPVTLRWDAQLEEPDGKKTTIARGDLTILPDVTNG